MIKQTLNVIPHGYIQSGSVILNIDETTGLIDASESVVVGVAIFSKTMAQSQELKSNPDVLKSANVKPGLNLQFGQVSLLVLTDPHTVDITYSNGSDNLSGIASLDLSGEFLVINHVDVKGTIDGYDVEIELQNQP